MITERAEFEKLCRTHPLVPVVKRIPADTETPVSTYLKAARGPWSFLLESVEGGTQWGRYSLSGSTRSWWSRPRGGGEVVSDGEAREAAGADPWRCCAR